ncbi:hypothetical protein J3R30DRAFT_3697950 [Lentinula aciculospora]|uniref:Uncharacterized protein n=1 Tax=Lentinula aciculospora TaxID=153920 RepID=A0A9W9AJF2_9AGAR|nr:hypothetical protein J3R30DRAFT_3697950 [Lentinula aciculospora]
MSHSTTTTAIYVLVKYSRSYPKSTQDISSEWQHYTKPTLKLILDVKKSLTTGELESVFLRIAWSMENSYAQDQSELTFENLDLLSFSSFPGRQTDRQGGLPLKAVFRDSVVGIRYINASNGTFRRFQITFSSAGDASQFIDSISSVCPCKANTTAGALANIPQTINALSMVPPTLQHPIAKPSTLSLNHMHSNVPINQMNVFTPIAQSHMLSTYPTQHFQRSSAPYASSGMPMPSSSQMLIDHRNQLPSSSPPLPPSGQPLFQFCASRAHSQSTPYTSTPTQSEHPYYSQTSSLNHHAASTQPSVNEPLGELATSRPKVKSSEKEIQTMDQFVFALREATTLYDMPHHTLEKLVGDVVREDGFVHLVSVHCYLPQWCFLTLHISKMEDLSLMWKVKGYIDTR